MYRDAISSLNRSLTSLIFEDDNKRPKRRKSEYHFRDRYSTYTQAKKSNVSVCGIKVK